MRAVNESDIYIAVANIRSGVDKKFIYSLFRTVFFK